MIDNVLRSIGLFVIRTLRTRQDRREMRRFANLVAAMRSTASPR